MGTKMHQEYRQLWKEAGYSTSMGSAAVVPPPLHKYMRVYHITSAEYAISDIALGHLKVARFSEANDPFELMALRYKARTREPLRGFKTTVNDQTGMLSFSEDWKEPVMWAHYGDKHRGICLGFNLDRKLAEKVFYEDTRLIDALETAGGKAELLSEKMQKQLRSTKFSSWRYEQEQRVMVPLANAKKSGDLHFYPFSVQLELVEVILGPKCRQPLDDVRTFVARLYPSATTFASRLADGYFAVVPKESTVP